MAPVANSCRALLFAILAATCLRAVCGMCPGCVAGGNVPKEVPAIPMTVYELLQADPDDLYDVIRLQISTPADDLPMPLNSTHKVTLRGKGSDIPTSLLQTPWPRPPPWNDNGYGSPSEPGLPPSTPPPPPSPPRPQFGPWYTIIDCVSAPNNYGTFRLEEGASLTLTSMAFYMLELYSGAVVGQSLSDIAFGLVEVSSGAVLRLEDVTLVLDCIALETLHSSLCQDPGAWPYNPKVKVAGDVMRIANLTSTVPDPDSRIPGAGGQVQWVNVTLTCPVVVWTKSPPCAARAVADGRELHAAARKALVDESTDTVILSITADVALPTDGSWEPVPLKLGQQLVLRGDPSRTTILDLSGIAEAWILLPAQPKKDDIFDFYGFFSRSIEKSKPGAQSVALLYDLFVVNLPLPTRSTGTMSLLALSFPSFGITRGVQFDGLPQLQVIRSTVVVPDQEAEFLLAGLAGRNSSDMWPGQPLGTFDIALMPDEASPEPSTVNSAARLDLLKLRLSSEVLLSNCTLLSASGYKQQLPGGAPLLNQSRLWLPQVLAARDPDTVAQWGPGGLAVASGLQQALTSLASCGSRPGYNPINLIWGPVDDRSISPLNASLASSFATITPANSGDALLTSAADSCIVDGGPTYSSGPELQPMLPAGGGGRVFSDLQGAIGRFALARPITLRNLVLYNLAPGGAYPSDLLPRSGPPLHPSDVAWENSSLPLWLFNMSRSYPDPGYQQLQQLWPMPPEAALLVLENVTLVVSEREWRALVAAVLLVHAPEALEEAQQRKQPPARKMLGGVLLQFPGLPPPPSYPPTPPPLPPQPPPPPPAPPYTDTTREALLRFAAASQVMSYQYDTGDLVLAVARHYGWSGTNVTIKYKLPPDAPGSAKLLSYPALLLPYDDLADMDIDLLLEFPIDKRPQPLANEGPPQLLANATESPTSTSSATFPASASPPSSITPLPASAPTPRGGRPSWQVPLAASLSAVAGAALLGLLATGAVLAARRRRGDRNGSGLILCSDAHGGLQEIAQKGQEVAVVCCRKESQQQLADGAAGAGAGVPRPSVKLVSDDADGGMRAAGGANFSLRSSKGGGPGFSLDAHPHRQACVPLISSDDGGGCVARPGGGGGGGSSVAEVVRDALFRAIRAASSSNRTLREAAAGESRQLSHDCSSLDEYISAVYKSGVGQAPAATSSMAEDGGKPSAGATDLDERTFVRALEVYFQGLWLKSSQYSSSGQTTKADGNGAQGTTSDETSSRRASKDIPAAIQAIQAELRDPDLQLNGIIGYGSFGVVYRGLWRGLPVAVKTLVVSQAPAGGSSQTGRVRQRAVLEAAISMAMSHPNVVATYSFDIKPLIERGPAGVMEENGQPCPGIGMGGIAGNAVAGGDILQHCDAVKLYILQESCNGGTIRDLLDRGLAGCVRAGGLPGMLALRLALDVARGMEHIHSCRIVHGDLKPENVLIVYNSGANDGALQPDGVPQSGVFGRSQASAVAASSGSVQLTAKVADFGLSVRMPEDATHVSQHFHGTPSYLAPEVAMVGELSPRADVWSFGLMLIELYFGCSLKEIHAACAAVHGSPDPLGRPQKPVWAYFKDVLTAMTDPSFVELVSRCLSQEPNQRPVFTQIIAVLQNMFVSCLRSDGFALVPDTQ